MTLDVAGLVEHVMKAWLLLYLCQDSIALREKYHSIGKILFSYRHFLSDIGFRSRSGSTEYFMAMRKAW